MTNVPNWYFKGVIFSRQRLMFKAVLQALYSYRNGRSTLVYDDHHILVYLIMMNFEQIYIAIAFPLIISVINKKLASK
ncbi:hypothetical protein P3F56_07355 [cyanobacterium endosymbiont of Epithemia clementina EcSB]|nr:hypothetical protein [cyanobacterium endosymbiont of Epithemia clementina EcSB]WGT68503.1 hypothetical protein P3F56_07355 [cyanobacterium endosymbiont of Epithemia clementina EcSB]